MSILIKGMEMPKNCLECVFYRAYSQDYDYCCISSAIPKGYVPADCPLVPIPYHGDLIDREAWKKSLIYEGETIGIDGFSIDGLSADDVCYAIENAPVVIPAERREE